MNPDWAERARRGSDHEIAQAIGAPDIKRLAVPGKLWTVIEATPGWFKIRQEA
jgi:hypothetical protein